MSATTGAAISTGCRRGRPFTSVCHLLLVLTLVFVWTLGLLLAFAGALTHISLDLRCRLIEILAVVLRRLVKDCHFAYEPLFVALFGAVDLGVRAGLDLLALNRQVVAL